MLAIRTSSPAATRAQSYGAQRERYVFLTHGGRETFQLVGLDRNIWANEDGIRGRSPARDGARIEAGELESPFEAVPESETTLAKVPTADREDQEDNPTGWTHLPGDLKESFEAFFSSKNLLSGAVIAAGTAGAWPFDDEVQEYWGRSERLGGAAKIASNKLLLVGAFSGLIAAGRLVDNERFRLMTSDLMQGFAVNNAVTFAVKAAVQRERPDGGNFSFPSGHASNMFTAAVIIGHHYGLKASIPLYLLATFVSVARLDENSHWLSDTVAGAGLGLLVGHTIAGKWGLPTPSRHIAWMPVVSGDGVAIRLFINH